MTSARETVEQTMTPSPSSQLRAMVALAEKATLAPWDLDHDDRSIAGPSRSRGDWDWICLPPEDDSQEEMLGRQLKDNMRFIAAARNTIPSLKLALERMGKMEEWIRRAEHHRSCALFGYRDLSATTCTCGRDDVLRSALRQEQV